MSFNTVIQAIKQQLRDDAALSEYVDNRLIVVGFKENISNQEYVAMIEPMTEEERVVSSASRNLKEMIYQIDIYLRMISPSLGSEGIIIGKSGKKGLLEFTYDVRRAIKDDLTLGLDSPSYSLSQRKTSDTYVLSGTLKYISVRIGDSPRTGYNTINCGESSLSGSAIATNIQTALRSLGKYADDGYTNAVCTFDSTKNQFTIKAGIDGPQTHVVVTAGASDDCSSVLGYDVPIPVVGTNVTQISFGTVTPNNDIYPVRYRVLPISVYEEVRDLGGN